MLDERQKNILSVLVREYITTAEPVSSEKVARRIRTLSPATIRNVFGDLTEMEYIEQPHISGGRIPLTMGYRFYVDSLFDNDKTYVSGSSAKHSHHAPSQKELAKKYKVLSRFGELMPVGFDEMFQRPEFSEQEVVLEMAKFLDEFENYRYKYLDSLDDDSFEVFIGEENTIQPSKCISLIIGKDRSDDLFFIAGPLRMNYESLIPIMTIWKRNPQKK